MSLTERPLLILIAEDDPDDQLMLKRAFQHAGFAGDVEFCADGVELLERLERRGARVPSLVLLDLKMPRVGGLEALASMRKKDKLRGLPVVAVTTSDMPRDVRMAYELGVNAYVRKPVDLDGLRRVVSALKHFWLDTAILPDTILA